MASQGTNLLLARLPSFVHERLLPHLKLTAFEPGQVLYEARAPIDNAYFPLAGTLSAVVVMLDGSIIEVATIGNEGVIGVTQGGLAVSANRVFCQIAGSGMRINAETLQAEVQRNKAFQQLMDAYQAAFHFQVSQSVACNGLHGLQQRCSRWLLMTHDRVDGDEIGLTQEFLAAMLGVRRSSVSEVLQALVDAGMIRHSRGKITVTNRAQMECLACECYQAVRDEYQRLLG